MRKTKVLLPHEKYMLAYNTNRKEWSKKIISYLEQKGEANVQDIAKHIGKLHSHTSQYLRKLRQLGYVETDGQGEGHYCMYYVTDRTYVDNMKEFAKHLTEKYGS